MKNGPAQHVLAAEPSLIVRDKEEAMRYEELRLQEMGYKQVLHRGWRWFTNLAVTISSMSVLLSITGSFGTGLTFGGPVVCLWGWILVSLLNLCVALGMAELASAYPTSGGMYYWIFQLTPPRFAPLVCWVTGWLNLLGQIASLASTHYFMAYTISTIVLLATGTAAPTDQQLLDAGIDYGSGSGRSLLQDASPSPDPPADDDYVAWPEGPGWVPTKQQFFGIYTGCLITTAVINSLPFEHVGFITEIGAWWTLIGVFTVIIAIPCISTERATPEWVFRKFEGDLAKESGIRNPFYIFILGLLLPAYSFTGYDGPAHMTEESTNASLAAPWGILLGVFFMIVVGWSWVLSLLFCVSDYNQVLGSYPGGRPSEAAGDPVAQIFWNAFKQRTGSGTGGIIMLLIPLGGIYFCAHSTLTYVARILFAYSRDKAVPLPWLWIKFNKTLKAPLIAVWGTVLFAFLLGLPMLGSEEAFTAIISLSTIALNIAYVAPTTARILPYGAKMFKRGPFHLGVWAYPVGVIATLWVAFIVVVFSLPTEYPATKTNLNYAGVTLLATFALSLIWYFFPVYGAYAWFKGPVHTVDESADPDTSPVAGVGVGAGLADAKGMDPL
ncbi:hypothetical protein HYH03_018798 [Edaphochlamys debaryana]|uniref:Uncharacterized protein n=1 Tax=Edaphochlamys debaryana TaxID=47281 RepID=A0A835XL51_9CHLO|nr:hypothetical protein HYH03_018798 [Edaphochlamys debaryana]|eukprot:KAG2482254.1 hypothetical protein HYH03_018798 [Edaphochlamys debaryana]